MLPGLIGEFDVRRRSHTQKRDRVIAILGVNADRRYRSART